MNSFQEFGASRACVLLCYFEVDVQTRDEKIGNEILGDLHEPIRVAINFSLLPRHTEIDGTRHAAPCRSSGVPVMCLVAPMSRIHLSLRQLVLGKQFRSFSSEETL